jgi:pheromone shutdown-related protein TraB
VHTAFVDGREFVLIGTAHVSQESADLVREVIEETEPDGVCIELDAGRYEALSKPQRFEGLDLRQVIRKRQLATLILNLVMASYQRSIGLQLGVRPGTELLEGAKAAEERGIPIHLCDREVGITLRRAWNALSLWKKLLLLSTLFAGIFEKQELTEEDLRELRKADVLSNLLTEMGEAFPGIKRVLIDERDAYLAERIRQSEGQRLVAVVGAGHVQGILSWLERPEPVDLEPLTTVPEPTNALRWVGWAVPVVIVGALIAIGMQQGFAAARENLLFWVLANGVPAAIGAIIALANPLVIVAAFVSAPLTSLTPVIGVGYVTGFLQAWLRPPFVHELSSVLDDLGSVKGLWKNRLLRILLVFGLTTIGSLIGTGVGGAEILTNLFDG